MNIRAPRFLRKIIDFELNTGNDISGRHEIRKEFNKRWISIDKKTIITFLEKYHKNYIINKFNRSYLLHNDLDNVKKDFIDDLYFFHNYDLYIKNLEEDKIKQEQIRRELDALYIRIVKDFNENPSKYNFSKKGDYIKYTFKNGEYVEVSIKKGVDDIIANGIKYTANTYYFNKFIGLIYSFMLEAEKNKKNSKNRYSTSNIKSERITKLEDIINIRKEQISKINKKDDSYINLFNELNVYEDKLKKLKKQYSL